MLIQTIVAVVISAVAMLAIANVQVQQVQETKAVGEHFAVVDVQRHVGMIAADTDMCSTVMTTALAGQTIDVGSSSTVVDINELTMQPGTPPLVKVGDLAAPLVQSLLVTSIQLRNFDNTPIANKYAADLVVTFGGPNATKTYPPASAKIFVMTSGAPASATITKCLKSISDGGFQPAIRQVGCYWQTTCQNTIQCQPGEYAAGIQTYTQSYHQYGAMVCSNFYCCRP